MREKKLNIISIAAMYIGTIMGAGFASRSPDVPASDCTFKGQCILRITGSSNARLCHQNQQTT